MRNQTKDYGHKLVSHLMEIKGNAISKKIFKEH